MGPHASRSQIHISEVASESRQLLGSPVRAEPGRQSVASKLNCKSITARSCPSLSVGCQVYQI